MTYEIEAAGFDKRAVQLESDGDKNAAAKNLKVAGGLRKAACVLRERIKGEALILLNISFRSLSQSASVQLCPGAKHKQDVGCCIPLCCSMASAIDFSAALWCWVIGLLVTKAQALSFT